MRNSILAISTAVVVSYAAPVLAQDNLDQFLEGIAGMVTSQGASLTFDARNVGADGSIEYTGFSLTAPDNEVVIAADWIKGVPSPIVPGQVTITLSPHATFTVNDGPSITIDIANTGLTIMLDGITSGQDAETLNFSVVADSLAITSAQPDHPFLHGLNVAITNLNEAVSFSPSTMLVTNTGSMSAMQLMYDFTSPEGDKMFSDGEMTGATHSLRVIADDSERNIADYFSGAQTAFFTLDVASSSADARIENRDINLDYSGNSGPAHIELRAENGRVTYDISMAMVSYAIRTLMIEGDKLPGFDLSLDELKTFISFPTATSDTFQPASLIIALRNLTIPENLISMVDPDKTLPRDAINVVVDLNANVKPRVNWEDPEAAFDSGNPMDIGEIQDISINQLLISGAGAEITADGNADIDNSMGFPFPSGSVTVVAKGVQGLVNGMVALGLLPQGEAGMAMGFVLAFARPGATADEFVSDIEFSPQGVTANGIPLPL